PDSSLFPTRRSSDLFNVPAGYAALLPFLERDDALARAFFAKLRLIFYAGAALPQDLWERIERVSARAIGQRVPMTSSWGMTETRSEEHTSELQSPYD